MYVLLYEDALKNLENAIGDICDETNKCAPDNPKNKKKLQSTCRPIFFSNGGKMGSTTLAALLKHQYPSYESYNSDGPFDNAEKEICWSKGTVASFAKHFQTRCTPPHLYALDACPRPSSESRLNSIKKSFPEAVIIMLMREQSAAALSFFKDRASSQTSLSGDISSRVLEKAISDNILYDFVGMYKLLLKYFDAKKIVVVQTEEMNSDEGAWNIVKAVAKTAEFSVPAKVKHFRTNNADRGGERYNEGWITEEAREQIKRFWFKKNKQMEELVPGFRLHVSFFPHDYDVNATYAQLDVNATDAQ